MFVALPTSYVNFFCMLAVSPVSILFECHLVQQIAELVENATFCACVSA
jgi:hypothetical protein